LQKFKHETNQKAILARTRQKNQKITQKATTEKELEINRLELSL